MIPTLKQVAEMARQVMLGETEIAGGQVWTDAALLSTTAGIGAMGPIGAAYEAMVQSLLLHSSRLIRREGFWIVPANTGFLAPSTANWLNMGEPLDVWDRVVKNYQTGITAASSNAGVAGSVPPYLELTFNAAHPFVTGQTLTVMGITGGDDSVNDTWTISVPDNTHVRLNGCVADATGMTFVTAMVADSTEAWPAIANLAPVADIATAYLNSNSSSLNQWSFVNGAFRFQPCSTARQIKVLYNLSGTCPTVITASVGVEGSLLFLSTYAAALALGTKGQTMVSQRLFQRACGNESGDIRNNNGGYLGVLLQIGDKGAQVDRIQIPPFRPWRNRGVNIRY